jgi:uncharacterized membrane protein
LKAASRQVIGLIEYSEWKPWGFCVVSGETMDTTSVLALAFAIGVIAGLRSMTAPAVVSLAAHWKWLELGHSPLAFLASTVAAYIFAAGALVELVVDKLPKTPRRTEALGLIARFALGGLSGAALCAAANQSAVIGAVLGGVGGVAGGFAGYGARNRLVNSLKMPDLVVALVEDAVAIGVGFVIVSRF